VTADVTADDPKRHALGRTRAADYGLPASTARPPPGRTLNPKVPGSRPPTISSPVMTPTPTTRRRHATRPSGRNVGIAVQRRTSAAHNEPLGTPRVPNGIQKVSDSNPLGPPLPVVCPPWPPQNLCPASIDRARLTAKLTAQHPVHGEPPPTGRAYRSPVLNP
jgi:hypothetical protein